MPKGERRNLPHTAMCGILFLLHAAIPLYGEARDAFEEVFDKLKAMDAARGAASEAEVRQWREEKRLPFPDYDFAERAEMAGTLPFPPEDSPDYRPSLPRPAGEQPIASGGTRRRDWLRRRGEGDGTDELSASQRRTRRPRRASTAAIPSSCGSRQS